MRPETTRVVDTRWQSGLGNLGPFVANYTAQATPIPGVASAAASAEPRSQTLLPRSGRQALDLELHLSFDLGLDAILPATKMMWPTVTVRVSYRDCLVGTHEPAANSASLLAAIALAVSDVMLDVPSGAPFISVVLDAVLASIGVEGTASFLRSIVSSLTTCRAALVPEIDAVPAGYADEDQQVLEPAWA